MHCVCVAVRAHVQLLCTFPVSSMYPCALRVHAGMHCALCVCIVCVSLHACACTFSVFLCFHYTRVCVFLASVCLSLGCEGRPLPLPEGNPRPEKAVTPDKWARFSSRRGSVLVLPPLAILAHYGTCWRGTPHRYRQASICCLTFSLHQAQVRQQGVGSVCVGDKCAIP